ncbi:MAG: hypothetical protein PHT19_17635 [Methylococcus sp.]|nr:hypothetical protein [Methylococcus sp.]
MVSLNSPLATPFNFPVNNLIMHPEYWSWVNHPSSHQNVFGYRLAQMDSVLGSVAPGGEAEKECTKGSMELMEFFIERLKWLKSRYIPSVDLERGSIELRGRPDIQVGDFIHVKRGADAQVDWSAYVVRVTHSFRPYVSYTTTIEYIRSNQYIRRSKVDRPWELERKRVNT